jgi:hypothetical protein
MKVPQMNLPPRPNRMSDRQFKQLGSKTAMLMEYKRMHTEMWNTSVVTENQMFHWIDEVLNRATKSKRKEAT